MNIKRNLSETLKAYRSLEQKSLVDFAEELSIGKTTLQDIESCKANPRWAPSNRLPTGCMSIRSPCFPIAMTLLICIWRRCFWVLWIGSSVYPSRTRKRE